MRHLATSSAAALFAAVVPAQCPLPSPGAADPLLVIADGWSSHPIGFAFPFDGGTYTDLYVSDHGVVAFHNAGAPAAPPDLEQLYDPGAQPDTAGHGGGGLAGFGADVVCAYWGDHVQFAVDPDDGVYVDGGSGLYCTVTWRDNEPYNTAFGDPALAFSAQLVLFADGRIAVHLDGRCQNRGSVDDAVTTVIGVHRAADAVPASGVDLSANPTVARSFFEQFTGPGPAGTNNPDPSFDLADRRVQFVPTPTGWQVLTGPLPCATAVSSGAGCAGLSLSSPTPPAIGGAWTLQLSGVGATAEALALPSFAFFGAPTGGVPIGLLLPGLFGSACSIYMDGALGNLDLGPATGGVAAAALPIPPAMDLLGLALAAQGMSWDDPLGAPLFALSNLETGTVGL